MHFLLIGALITGLLAAAGDQTQPPADEGEVSIMNLANPFVPHAPAHITKLPIVVEPFIEHLRGNMPDMDITGATGIRIGADAKPEIVKDPRPTFQDGHPVNASVAEGTTTWIGTDAGLYAVDQATGACKRYESYGIDGPLATRITALALDSKGNLWVGTPIGLSRRAADNTWSQFQAKDGLPVEDITALAVDNKDQLWIGTSRGAIMFLPEAKGRKWFYRAGKRYLPSDKIAAIAIASEGSPVYFLTDAGVGRIDLITTTLLQKAQTIEKRLNERHRRLGMVSGCKLDPDDPASYEIPDNDNDGLWTAYHVAAMALCYGCTHDEDAAQAASAKQSARESMHALYMLQNASGVPGLVARSVLPPEIGKTKGEQWRPTPDGTMYWKSDTSNDEIDGHYLAFYTYYEHIAKDDPEEKELLIKQIRALTDYIIDHGYQLIDWHGKRTSWGFWDPASLNNGPAYYAEVGLNSLQILSFLKVASYVTGDAKYAKHYRDLMVKHHYLDNVVFTKKAFPDSVNHSDDQLGFVAWYPILQLEKDLQICRILYSGVRRHYEFVLPEQPSFYIFTYATIDSAYADLEGAVENLKQIPTDRRLWGCKNSVRDDVQFSGRTNRFGKKILTRVVPVDERCFERWNADPYIADHENYGWFEDDGAAYLLPYWMARYHGFIAEAN